MTRESRPLETLGRKLRPSHISGVHHVVLRFPIHSTPFFLTCSKVFVVRPRRQQHRQEIFQNRNLQRLASTLVWFDQSGPNYFPSSSPPVSQNHAMNPHVPKKNCVVKPVNPSRSPLMFRDQTCIHYVQIWRLF